MQILNNVALSLCIVDELDQNYSDRIVVRTPQFHLDSLALLTPKIKSKAQRLYRNSKGLSGISKSDVTLIEVTEKKLTVHFKNSSAKTFHIKTENSKVHVVDVTELRKDFGSKSIIDSINNIFGVNLSDYESYYSSIAEKSLKDAITALLNVLSTKINQAGLMHFFEYINACAEYTMTPYGAEIVTNFGDISYIDRMNIPKEFTCVTNPSPNPIISVYVEGSLLVSVRFKFETLYNEAERIKIVIEPGAAFKKLNGSK